MKIKSSKVSINLNTEDIVEAALPTSAPTVEQVRDLVFRFLELTRGTKKPILLQIDKVRQSSNMDSKNLIPPDLEKQISALAIKVSGFLAAGMVKAQITLSAPGYPCRVFTNRDNALRWLKSLP